MSYIKDEGPMPEDECQGILNMKLHDKIKQQAAIIEKLEFALNKIVEKPKSHEALRVATMILADVKRLRSE